MCGTCCFCSDAPLPHRQGLRHGWTAVRSLGCEALDAHCQLRSEIETRPRSWHKRSQRLSGGAMGESSNAPIAQMTSSEHVQGSPNHAYAALVLWPTAPCAD